MEKIHEIEIKKDNKKYIFQIPENCINELLEEVIKIKGEMLDRLIEMKKENKNE